MPPKPVHLQVLIITGFVLVLLGLLGPFLVLVRILEPGIAISLLSLAASAMGLIVGWFVWRPAARPTRQMHTLAPRWRMGSERRGMAKTPPKCPQRQRPGSRRWPGLAWFEGHAAGNRISTQALFIGVLVICAILIAVYGTIAFVARDLVWFDQRFETEPIRITVYHHGGQQTDLYRGHPDFEPLAQAVKACLSQGLERPSRMGFSEASLRDAYTRYLTVEAFFYQPVKLHAWFETPKATHMLLPVTGQHSQLPLVVLANGDQYLPSPPILETIEPLRKTLNSLGYR